jgi:hypothetical protein
MALKLTSFLHILSSWVKVRFYSENQLPRFFGFFLIYPIFFLNIQFSLFFYLGQKKAAYQNHFLKLPVTVWTPSVFGPKIYVQLYVGHGWG